MKLLLSNILSLLVAYNLTAQDFNKVAVVSIYGNEEFSTDWREGITVGHINLKDLIGRDKFSASEQVEIYRSLIFTELRPQFPFTIADEEVILGIEAYKAFDAYPNIIESNRYAAPEGYNILHNLAKPHFIEIFEFLPADIDGIMIVSLTFGMSRDNLAINTSMGGANGSASLHMEIFDRDGKKLLNLGGIGESKAKVKVKVNKVPEDEHPEIPGLIADASAALLLDVKAGLPKKLEKMSKKLEN